MLKAFIWGIHHFSINTYLHIIIWLNRKRNFLYKLFKIFSWKQKHRNIYSSFTPRIRQNSVGIFPHENWRSDLDETNSTPSETVLDSFEAQKLDIRLEVSVVFQFLFLFFCWISIHFQGYYSHIFLFLVNTYPYFFSIFFAWIYHQRRVNLLENGWSIKSNAAVAWFVKGAVQNFKRTGLQLLTTNEAEGYWGS